MGRRSQVFTAGFAVGACVSEQAYSPRYSGLPLGLLRMCHMRRLSVSRSGGRVHHYIPMKFILGQKPRTFNTILAAGVHAGCLSLPIPGPAATVLCLISALPLTEPTGLVSGP
jgi:hypothetical protein